MLKSRLQNFADHSASFAVEYFDISGFRRIRSISPINAVYFRLGNTGKTLPVEVSRFMKESNNEVQASAPAWSKANNKLNNEYMRLFCGMLNR